MKRLALALVALIAFGASAGAQVVTNPAVPPNTVCVYWITPPTLTDGQASWLQCDASGNLRTAVSGSGGAVTQGTVPWVVSGQGAAGTAATGVVTVQGIAAMTPFLTTNAGIFAVQAQPTPVTTGGLSVFFLQPTASDNHAVIKAGAGQIYKISVTNNSATVNYIRFYNATTGFNGCNSATNLVYENAIPASTSVGGLSDQWDAGMAFATGISICVTSGYATNDTTSATASAMNVNVGYK